MEMATICIRIMALILLIVFAVNLVGCCTEQQYAYAHRRNPCTKNVLYKYNGCYYVCPAQCPVPNACYCSLDSAFLCNFGCATNHNLAVMVANPRDVIDPKPTCTFSAIPLINATEQYYATGNGWNNMVSGGYGAGGGANGGGAGGAGTGGGGSGGGY